MITQDLFQQKKASPMSPAVDPSKVVLLGMNNPLGTRPEHALYPYPPGCTGWRIWDMISSKLEISKSQYLRAFERVNMIDSRTWDKKRAKLRIPELVERFQDRTVVVFGAQPRSVLGLPELLIHPQMIHGVTWRQLPHPSGRNLWYNDQTNRELAACLLVEMYELSVQPHRAYS